MEEVDKGCSEFCITVGTVTRTASILICNQLQALDVNLSQPSSRLWLNTVVKVRGARGGSVPPASTLAEFGLPARI